MLLGLIGVLIIPGYYVEERIRGKMAWEKYAAEARQRGVKLHFAELTRPEIPASENFASIPIFDAAFQSMGKDKTVPNPLKITNEKKESRPPFSDQNKQTPIDLAAWQKYFVKIGRLPGAGDNPAQDVLQALAVFDAPLAQLHEAETRPHCRFPVQWQLDDVLQIQLPHSDLLQDAARIEALRMTAHLALGDSAAAYEDFRHGWGLTMAIREEPIILSGLMRGWIAAVMENAVWAGLARHQWAEPELRKIEADVSAVDWLKDFIFAMNSDRAALNDSIDGLLRDPRQLVALAKKQDEDNEVKHSPWIVRGYPSGWVYQNRLRTNRNFDEILARVDPAQHRWFGDRPVPSAAANLKESGERFHYLLFRLMTPLMAEVEHYFIHMAAFSDEAKLACVLERFHLAHGQYPKALEDLVPEYLPTLPADVATGAPYHYKLTPKGRFILYSVGPNQRDDFGVIDPKLRAHEQSDWVWCYPVK